MKRNDLLIVNVPDMPGVYLFKKGRSVLYVGKATSLRDRVRSYFDDDLIATRGPRVVDMVTRATRVVFETTPTVLEALVREAALIRTYQPKANVEGKDDKSFLYAVITDEEIPRVLAVRGKDIDFKNKKMRPPFTGNLRSFYGPFPSGTQLREGLRLIRRIFPFFDTLKPVGTKSKQQAAKIEFNRQIGQYPHDRRFTSASSVGQRAAHIKMYRMSIRKVEMLLAGRGKALRRSLERAMHRAAKKELFEEAAEIRRELFALNHLQDVSLIKEDQENNFSNGVRIEAYDTAHLSGTHAVGVMVVREGGVPVKKEYRTFRIRGKTNVVSKSGLDKNVKRANDDSASLREILSRRFEHTEWSFPRVVVVDGGATHKKVAETALALMGIRIPVVAVVKDERHRPREVIGAIRAGISEADAVRANSEAHRFSLQRHRAARRRSLGA